MKSIVCVIKFLDIDLKKLFFSCSTITGLHLIFLLKVPLKNILYY